MIQLFSVYPSQISFYENLGIARIKTFLEEKGYQAIDTYITLETSIENQLSLIDKKMKYFGFSFQYTCADLIFAFAKEIKRLIPNSIIFVGGRCATDAYEIILNESEDIDTIILGHGEFPLYEAIKQLESGVSLDDISKSNIHIATKKNIENKIECYTDINLLSLPKRDFDTNKLILATICTSHGCIGKCTFCSWETRDTKWYGRSMKDVFEEIKRINIEFGIKIFNFVDASFEDPGLLGKQRINELCDYISEYGVPLAFRCFIRAETFKNNIDDINLLKKMRANGFSMVFVGIESIIDEELKLYNKRATTTDNLNILNLLEANDIGFYYGFIMMNPYSTLDTLKINYNFLKDNNCIKLCSYISVLSAYYKTKLYDILLKDDLLLVDYSYKNPTAYRNKYSETEAIKQFMQELHSTDLIENEYRKYYNSMANIYAIKVTHRNVYDYYIDDINKINQNIADISSEYFFNLFEKNDVSICRSTFGHFEQLLSREYNEFSKIVIKILKKSKYIYGK